MKRLTLLSQKCLSGSNGQRWLHNYFGKFSLGLSTKKSERFKNIQTLKSVGSIQNQSRILLNDLKASHSKDVTLMRLDHVIDYMKIHPIARREVFKANGIPFLIKLRQSASEKVLLQKICVALALLGYVDPVSGRGVRILALDGGGTRGMMSIEMLKHVSKLCGRPVHKLFDLIVGTSTGAILAFLIGLKHSSLEDCELLYDRLSKDIFNANRFVGTGKLFLNHAYYSTSALTNILKSELGEDSVLIDSASIPGPKVASVATLVNHPVLQAYVFRNYSLPWDRKKTACRGSSKHKLWEAVRASTAAPGYFEELILDEDVYQDGGLLTNNPTALALNEAKMLWPTTPIQTIVSIGTGSYHGRSASHTAQFTTLRQKLMKLVASATDVEAVHHIVEDLLKPSQYIRLNPNMSLDAPLDESRAEVLKQLQQDTWNYIDKFSHKFDAAALSLSQNKRVYDKVVDRVQLECLMKGWG